MPRRFLLICIILILSILATFYIAKLFYPAFVLGITQDPKVVQVGTFIDAHLWATILAETLMALFIYTLYVSAILGQRWLTKQQWLAVIATIIILAIFRWFVPELFEPANMISLVLLPAVFKPKTFNLAFAFSIYTFAQYMALGIRGLSMHIVQNNFATYFVLMIDSYITLLFLYLYLNYKKGGKSNGTNRSTSIQER